MLEVLRSDRAGLDSWWVRPEVGVGVRLGHGQVGDGEARGDGAGVESVLAGVAIG